MKNTRWIFVSVSLVALVASVGYAQKEKPQGDAQPVIGGPCAGCGIVHPSSSSSSAGKASISYSMEERAFPGPNGQLIVLGINPTQNASHTSSVSAPPASKIETTVYPNPTTGAFILLLPDGITSFDRVEVLDESGRTMADLTRTAALDGSWLRVPSANLPSGAYFVRVATHGKSVLYKLAVEH